MKKRELEKHKERLVSKGYAQQYRVYYDETFAAVARMATIRDVLSIAS